MKIRSVILGILLMAGGLCTSAMAQANLEKWVKDVQNVDNVDVTLISRRDPKTKKLTDSMISISFKNMPELEARLYEAARKDRDNATRVIENKRNGKVAPSVYEFTDVKDEQKMAKYIFSNSKNGTVSLVVKHYDWRYDGG